MENHYSMGMENQYPNSYMSSSNWTREENKEFERALAIFDKETPDRWMRVAAMIPGKSVSDVRKQYTELEDDVSRIEAGLVSVPGYNTPSFTLDWVDSRGFDKLNRGAAAGIVRSSDQERKKGVPWTEDEHRRFLLGLMKHGKGDWRNISRNFVVSKTPTQVASHAQKYYNRLNSGGKEKRRPSIHDMTTNNLEERPSSDKNKPPGVSLLINDFYQQHQQQQHNHNASTKVVRNWNDHNNIGSNMFFNGANVPLPYEIASGAVNKFQGQNVYNATGHRQEPYISTFTRYQIRG